MPRQLVWYPDGSPAADLAARLPQGFEAHPLSRAAAVRRRADDPEAILIDAERDGVEAVGRLTDKLGTLPVIALVSPAPDAAPPAGVFAALPRSAGPALLARLLEAAFERGRLVRELAVTKQEMEELNAIGVGLSAERDADQLLALILTKARQITHSDAGSIYLVEEPAEGQQHLRFKLTQNDFVEVPFTESVIPISHESVSGHVALSGEILHLADAYEPPTGARFRINRFFDEQIGYRTKSMLVVPMRTPAGETIGVLQLINCKRDAHRRFPSVEAIEREAIPYPERFISLAASLASQAAVALQNSRLLENIQSLFEGFVRASVTAIESRDPTTSGHSFRVADLTVGLAAAVDRTETGPYRDVRFTPTEMREIRYASLLHDFGKVGVREDVLVKAKKLYPQHLELIRQRAEIIRRGVQLRYSQRKLELLLREGREQFALEAARADAELRGLLEEIDAQLQAVVAANEPTVMADETAARIQELALERFLDHLGQEEALITPEEARILSIPRGSLTPEEYQQIQSHVVHTYQFLIQIPWTRELQRVPEIARSHHEKLNGGGYPQRLAGPKIPVGSRMMTITDIFDALTASDRPYKSAVPVPRALDILDGERKAGAIDPHLFEIFLLAKPWDARRRR